MIKIRSAKDNTSYVSKSKLLSDTRAESGIALLLVIFIVALATIIVVNLTYSGFLNARLNNATAKGLQAEYLLKSTINFARALIKEDVSAEDAYQDVWGIFVNSQAIPVQLFDIDEPNIKIELEITPEDAKLSLRKLLRGQRGGVDLKWRSAITKLFRKLGFDDDGEQDHTGTFPGRVFNAEELVAMLVDYMDTDTDSYDGGADFASGLEGELSENNFSNQRVVRTGELSNIPGFTPARMRKLAPLATVFDNGRVNINLAYPAVLESLSDDIGPDEVEAILDRRKETPFEDVDKNEVLSSIIGDDVYTQISTMIDVKSSWFQVLAKVDYGTSTHFMRAYVRKTRDPEELPKIMSMELF